MKTLDNITVDKIIALFWTWITWRDITADHLDECGVIKSDNYTPITKYDAADAYKKKFFFDCPCCSFIVKHYKRKISGSFCHGAKCPMKSVWGGRLTYACEKSELSPYKTYRHNILDYRRNTITFKDFLNNVFNRGAHKNAKKISEGARRLYTDLCKHHNITPVDEHFNPKNKNIKKLHQPKAV